MSSKIIKLLLSLSVWGLSSFLAYSEPNPSEGIWDMILDEAKKGFFEGIEDGSRSEIQNIFSPLANIRFSNASELEIMKAAGSLGLSNPTAENAFTVINQRSNSLKKSPLTTLYNQKLSRLGYPKGNPFVDRLLLQKAESMKKERIEDFFNRETLKSIQNFVAADSLTMNKLYSACVNNPRLTALINGNPQCVKLFSKEPYVLELFSLPALNHFSSNITPHAGCFKPGVIPDTEKWTYSNRNGKVLISSPNGIVAEVRSNNSYILGNDISLLNCDLPPYADIKFENSIIKTDALGRVAKIVIEPKKAKFQDKLKQQLKDKEIVLCKGGVNKKPFLLIPKDWYGTNTWNNVVGIPDSKANKEALNILKKKIKEITKNGGSLSAEISYFSTTSKPAIITYYEGSNKICDVYAEETDLISSSPVKYLEPESISKKKHLNDPVSKLVSNEKVTNNSSYSVTSVSTVSTSKKANGNTS